MVFETFYLKKNFMEINVKRKFHFKNNLFQRSFRKPLKFITHQSLNEITIFIFQKIEFYDFFSQSGA